MEGTVAGVRIVPPVVEFFDAESDVVHQMTLTVQNSSKTSKSIRFHGPASNCFTLKAKNPEHAIAPGLEVSALVEYYTTKAEDAQDRVILVVDNDVVEIPLVAYTPCPQLELSGPADFGVTVADSKVLMREIFITNEGSLTGEFKIRYNGNQPITIMPSGGIIKPGARQFVKIEFISKTPGKLNEEAQIKLDGQSPTTLHIIGNVVERSLELLTLDTEENIETINFGSTYYGTDQIQSFLIYNNGPDVANFVVILEEGGEGQELGVDLTKSATAMLLSQTNAQELGNANDLTTLVTALPNQGILHPQEKREIHFRFSPRYAKSTKGWVANDQPPPRKDYTLFMHIETVGSVSGGGSDNRGSRVEVAILGTALPVLLSISPSPVFKFGDCLIGEQVDILCTVNNESASLPLIFSLHSTAHFHSSPSQAHINPGMSLDVLLTFRPNQMGSFKPLVPLEVLGGIVEQFSFDGDPTLLRLVPIYTTPISFHGSGTRATNKLKTQPAPGVPQVAHPNDRATSVRPAKRNETVKTLFTGIERYTYIDPDYAFTEEEQQLRLEHKQQYLDYIKSLRQKRQADSKRSDFHQFNNNTDLGMRSTIGLKPPKISAKEVTSPVKAPSPVRDEVKLLSSMTLADEKSKTLLKTLSDGLNAVPMTERERQDCSSVLSPQELKLVDIGPSLMDFGQVCLRSASSRDLMIVNNLNSFIHVVVEIDCRELRQTSPLSQVIPPNSVAKLAMMFESNVRGRFERSINYSINGYHHQHIVVLAEVVSVALELSSDKVLLRPSSGLLVDSGTVDAFTSLECEVVYQPTFSAPEETDFLVHVTGGSDLLLTCIAKLGSAHCTFVERRLLFGSVPLHLTTVKCVSLQNTSQDHAYFEVIDTCPIPGMIISPKEGIVPVGGTAELQVEFTPNSIHKFDTHIQVNVRGWKTISLRVGGTVEPPCVDIDVNLFQFGGVHCGALATIKFLLTNKTRTQADMVFDLSRFLDFSLKFLDNEIEDDPVDDGNGVYHVSLKGQKVLECALEFHPSEVASYDFVIPVSINHAVAPTPAPSTFPPTPAPSHMNWTISDLVTPLPSLAGVATPSRRVVATALRPPLQLSHSVLEFHLPSGYFDLGIESGAGRAQGCLFVNNSDKPLSWTLHTKAAGPFLEDGTFKFLHRTGSPFTPSSAGKKSFIPDITLESGETFQLGVLFTPQSPGLFVAHVPVILNGSRDIPYRTLTLRGELLAPSLAFDPESIRLMPVPLNTKVSVNFNITARGYRRASVLDCEIPQVELEDGSLQSVLEITFPGGQSIQPCCTNDDNNQACVIPCTVTFQSPSPVTCNTAIVFTDGKENYELPVTATADNCLFSCYPFLAAHQTDFHIVCEQKALSIKDKQTDTQDYPPGEPVFMPCITPNRTPTVASTSATSTSFGISTSTYLESSNEATSSTYPSTPHHGESQPGGPVRGLSDGSETNGTFVLGPGAESDERKFMRKVVGAIQRYFSGQGWSGGPYPIAIPQTLRSALQDTSDPQVGGTGAARTSNWDNNSKIELRSAFDLISHMCGRPFPGIPLASTLPTCPVDRVRQIHWMYSTLLTFLRTQGAMVAHVKPEDLLDTTDYIRWHKIQRKLKGMDKEDSGRERGINKLEVARFETCSTQAWTYILSQLVKVLILSRITPHQFRKLQFPNKVIPLPEVNPDPLTSNVYSVGERILLAWINHHYNVQRNTSWPVAIGDHFCCEYYLSHDVRISSALVGSSPPCRWIVNFDVDFMDGLVLAALVSAHVPFVISTHLHSMYTRPSKAEQCLHNVIKVVEALRHIGLDYDIQVRLQNPSTKPLVYQALLVGKDAADFRLPMGDTIQVSPKGQLQMPVEFKSRFLRPCDATLVLVGKREGSPCGNTLVFTLETCINNIVPVATITSESPCYQLQMVNFDVTNPFPSSGEFRIVLVEARNSFPGTSPPKVKASKSSKKLKKVGSRTDHGQMIKSPRREFAPKIEQHKMEAVTAPPSLPTLSAFWSPIKNIHLEANCSATAEIHFLPFDVGFRQCSILFINEKIGEFLYCIEAIATPPLPSPVPVVASPHSVRISSAAAARTGRGAFGGDERVVYWKCDNDESFTEDLYIPLVNETRENALAIAAQQRMSEQEFQRRMLTGTLTSCSVTASVAALGLGGDKFLHPGDSKMKKALEREITEFHTELSSKYFQAPSKVIIPASIDQKSAELTSGTLKSGPLRNTVSLPVSFQPNGPGHYPCRIVLKSAHDMRVYQLECTVTPVGSALELEFTSPTHQSVTQDIPVRRQVNLNLNLQVNQSNQDWQLAASLEGEGFYGPPVMVAKSRLTTSYPLMFKPCYEGHVEGKLVLTNTLDGTEQVYRLMGTGQKPHPLDHILIECPAKQSATYTLQVPNVTKNKLIFQVKTDLDIVSGPSAITVLPGKTAEHVITVSPWKRGTFNGIVSFVSSGECSGSNDTTRVRDDEEHDGFMNSRAPNDDVEELLSQGLVDDPKLRPYRLWYTVEIQASGPQPERTLEVTCAAHSAVAVEIAVTNPTRDRIVMDVLVDGVALSGEPTIVLHPRQQVKYQVTFAPTVIGEYTGSVIFQHEAVGEFWYDLMLKATTPLPLHLPSIHCEIGKSTYQMIRLQNPTDESLVLTPYSSNAANFSLELDDTKQILLGASGLLEIPLKFTPSAIGQLHSAEISFHCSQLGRWVFLASGTGMMPGPVDPINIYSQLGGNSSVIIPFKNPTERQVIVDVIMKERLLSRSGSLFTSLRIDTQPKDSVFCLLLKRAKGIILEPGAILDIPISFAPDTMQLYEATVTVTIHRDTEDNWNGNYPSLMSTRMVNDLHWIFPVRGIPESCPIKESQAPCIECKARSRVEERLEVMLTGVAPNNASSGFGRYPSITPINLLGRHLPGEMEYGVDYLNVPEEFRYELIYEDAECQTCLERSLGVSLIRKIKNQVSGVVILVFNFVFSPFKPFSHKTQLMISAASGGVWRFPLRVLATEAEVDDTITIDSVGLNMESVVGFRMTSQMRHALPFEAFFAPNSDLEFTVTPTSGELTPAGTEGTLIKVSYKPQIYGKTHMAKLVVQCPDMQWTYDVIGKTADYSPPNVRSKIVSSSANSGRTVKQKKNYVLDNLKLQSTAVSSPYKGVPLVPRSAR
ncbi:Calponin-likey domain-containing protein 2 [Stylophora pistillata]|uniref:Calponin-likey domain-containing protein 2 n=1 Tax=Stylophora pistillata TaxID=50429 RepID=A0A2B4T0L2_STYPI|nr:Calponin-likey domain-containing protein 2 [Stylophora pistillata]